MVKNTLTKFINLLLFRSNFRSPFSNTQWSWVPNEQINIFIINNDASIWVENSRVKRTRILQAFTVTWVLETLHCLLVSRAHICISTAHFLLLEQLLSNLIFDSPQQTYNAAKFLPCDFNIAYILPNSYRVCIRGYFSVKMAEFLQIIHANVKIL